MENKTKLGNLPSVSKSSLTKSMIRNTWQHQHHFLRNNNFKKINV